MFWQYDYANALYQIKIQIMTVNLNLKDTEDAHSFYKHNTIINVCKYLSL